MDPQIIKDLHSLNFTTKDNVSIDPPLTPGFNLCTYDLME